MLNPKEKFDGHLLKMTTYRIIPLKHTTKKIIDTIGQSNPINMRNRDKVASIKYVRSDAGGVPEPKAYSSSFFVLHSTYTYTFFNK